RWLRRPGRGGRTPGCPRIGASCPVRALPASGFARGPAERRVREHPGSARRLRTADRAGNASARDPQRREALRHTPPRRELRSLPSPPGLPQHASGRRGPLTARLASAGSLTTEYVIVTPIASPIVV